MGRVDPARRRTAVAGGHVRGGSALGKESAGSGQYVALGGAVGSREARDAVGRWGERAVSSSSGGGGNGMVELGGAWRGGGVDGA
jgi:hypothetical protein